MGDNDWVDGYRKAVSTLLNQEGEFVRLDAYDDIRSWTAEGDYEEFRVTYGWRDWDHHKSECGIAEWNLPTLREKRLSQFRGTFTSNDEQVGMEMKATCNCGKYTDKWVRYTGSLGEALQVVLCG